MNPILKIHRALYTALLQELRRPHPFAWERVSFLTANAGQDGELVLPTVQYPVPDDQYVPDTTSAACIGSAAIRAAISRALTEQVSIFHVHLHDHLGAPWFSH